MYENYYYPQETLRKSVAKTFIWMALGLLVTAITSFICYKSGWFLWILVKMPMLSLVFAFLQIGLVFAFHNSMARSSSTGMKVLFMVYALTLGITMTSVLYTFSTAVITYAFLISSIYFVCLGFVGFTTKKDLSKLGTLCFVALIVMIASQLIMMIFRVPMDTRFMSILGLIIFTGITAWDMQRLNQMLVHTDGDVVTQEKVSIYMALELYMDFINIFLYILRLVSNNKD